MVSWVVRTYPELGAVTQPTGGWVVRPSCLAVLVLAEPQPGETNINQGSLPGPGPVNNQTQSASHNRLDGGNFSLLVSSEDTE